MVWTRESDLVAIAFVLKDHPVGQRALIKNTEPFIGTLATLDRWLTIPPKIQNLINFGSMSERGENLPELIFLGNSKTEIPEEAERDDYALIVVCMDCILTIEGSEIFQLTEMNNIFTARVREILPSNKTFFIPAALMGDLILAELESPTKLRPYAAMAERSKDIKIPNSPLEKNLDISDAEDREITNDRLVNLICGQVPKEFRDERVLRIERDHLWKALEIFRSFGIKDTLFFMNPYEEQMEDLKERFGGLERSLEDQIKTIRMHRSKMKRRNELKVEEEIANIRVCTFLESLRGIYEGQEKELGPSEVRLVSRNFCRNLNTFKALMLRKVDKILAEDLKASGVKVTNLLSKKRIKVKPEFPEIIWLTRKKIPSTDQELSIERTAYETMGGEQMALDLEYLLKTKDDKNKPEEIRLIAISLINEYAETIALEIESMNS